MLAIDNEGIAPSMSRKGNCWDNAAMELFFSRLKVEDVFAHSYQNLGEAYSSAFEYIEMFYNRIRRHSANGQISTVEYENIYYEMCAYTGVHFSWVRPKRNSLSMPQLQMV